MKNRILVILLFTWLPLGTMSQIYRFVDEPSQLVGFKDSEGRIVAEPQFDINLCPEWFKHIAIVCKPSHKRYHFCYLTSQGKIIENFAPYFFDNGPDSEQNGFIRFKDKHNDKTGLLNREGQVVIAPLYNDITPVRNGFVVVLTGAEKRKMGEEHWGWFGGETLLLDTLGKVLIDNFECEDLELIDYSSVEISTLPCSDTTRFNFPGHNGNYYSFANHIKVFDKWLNENLLENFTKERFKALLAPCVKLNIDYGVTQSVSPDTVVDIYYDKFYNTLTRIKDKDCEFSYSYEASDDDDTDSTIWVIVESTNNIQQHFDFSLTADGYKLISATFRSKHYSEYE